MSNVFQNPEDHKLCSMLDTLMFGFELISCYLSFPCNTHHVLVQMQSPKVCQHLR